MLDEFCREIRLGTASTKQYEDDLLKQARILDATRTSHAEGRAVSLAELEKHST
jgi:predicted dehydrogenase